MVYFWTLSYLAHWVLF